MIVALAYALLLLAAGSIPCSPAGGGPLGGLSPSLQNLLHVPAYGLLLALWRRAVGRDLAVLAGCIAWGGLDEAHQMLVPGRYPSVVDWGLDALGCALALLIVRRVAQGKSAPITTGRSWCSNPTPPTHPPDGR